MYLRLDGTILTDLFKNQILSLTIRIRKNKQISTKDENTIIFTDIFTVSDWNISSARFLFTNKGRRRIRSSY